MSFGGAEGKRRPQQPHATRLADIKICDGNVGRSGPQGERSGHTL